MGSFTVTEHSKYKIIQYNVKKNLQRNVTTDTYGAMNITFLTHDLQQISFLFRVLASLYDRSYYFCDRPPELQVEQKVNHMATCS